MEFFPPWKWNELLEVIEIVANGATQARKQISLLLEELIGRHESPT
jgi:hypothetical protein